MAKTIYWRTALTGGGAGKLDDIDGDNLLDEDGAFTIDTNRAYIHELDAASGAAEDVPLVISPNANPGNKRWILKGSIAFDKVDYESLTIASGVLTVTRPGNWKVATEGGAATDDLDQIVGLQEGEKVYLKIATAGQSVVIKNGANMLTGSDFTLNSIYDRVCLESIGGDQCVGISRHSYD